LFFAKISKNTSHLTPAIAADVRNMQKTDVARPYNWHYWN